MLCADGHYGLGSGRTIARPGKGRHHRDFDTTLSFECQNGGVSVRHNEHSLEFHPQSDRPHSHAYPSGGRSEATDDSYRLNGRYHFEKYSGDANGGLYTSYTRNFYALWTPMIDRDYHHLDPDSPLRNDSWMMSAIRVPSTFEHEGQTYTVTAIGDSAFAGSNIVTVHVPRQSPPSATTLLPTVWISLRSSRRSLGLRGGARLGDIARTRSVQRVHYNGSHEHR